MFHYFKQNDFFTIIFNILRYLLIFPPDDDRKKKIHFVLFFIHFGLTSATMTVLEIWYLFVHPDGFTEAVKTAGTVSYHLLSTIRIVHARFNADTYIEMCNILKRRSFNFENFDFTKLLTVDPILKYRTDSSENNYEIVKMNWKTRNIFDPDTLAKRNTYKTIQDRLMLKARKKSYFCWLLIFVPAVSSVIFSYLACYVSAGKMYTDKISGEVKVRREIPYNSMQLLDTNNPVYHMICLSHQFYSLFYLSHAFLVTDSLGYGIGIHMTEQLEMIRIMLGKIKITEQCLYDLRLQRTVDAQFTKCTEEINILINLNTKFNNFMHPMFLSTYQLAIYVMCSIIYALPEEKDPLKYYGYAAFGVLSMMLPLLHFWNFELLSAKFLELSDAMYNIDFWGNATTAFKRKVLFGIRVLQQPIKITVGKLAVLNLDYFILMIQKGYAMYTLFNNTNKIK